jgi:hypothetical protein
MKKSAAARTGFLFDPGPKEQPQDAVTGFSDGTFLRVVRWCTAHNMTKQEVERAARGEVVT